MKTTDSAMREKLGEIREQLKDRITEAYFIFSKKDKPEFKTLEEGEAWTRQHNYIAKKMIGSSLDNIMTMLSHSLAEARREVVVQIKKNGFTRRRGETIKQIKLSQEEEIGYQMCQKDILDTLDLLTGDNPEEAK